MSEINLFRGGKSVVHIWNDAKAQIDDLVKEFPEIKKIYFISDALIEAVQKARMERRITDSGENSHG